jgi:hypothetical protein
MEASPDPKPHMPLVLPQGFKRADIKPAYFTRLNDLETPLHPDMFPGSAHPETEPDIAIDTHFDRDALIASTPISEAVPVLLGLRAFIAERRIQRAQSQIERLAATQRVVGFVGRAIIKDSTITPRLARAYDIDSALVGKGYMHPDNPLRPTTLREQRAARKLDKITTKRRVNQGLHGHLGSSFPDIVDSERTSSLLYDQTDRDRSVEERLHLGKKARHYRILERKISRQDEKFAKVISSPSTRAQRHRERRDKLVVKQATYDNARSAREAKKRARA